MSVSRKRSATNRTPALAGKGRQPRADGDATRIEIIETAGRLFAERGYLGTTSKSICEQAGVNIAAINYHFGSRDGLYLAVLKEVHRRFMSMEFLRELSASTLPAADKLHRFLVELVRHVLDADNWTMQVWAREILSPTSLLERVFQEETQPKFEVLATIVGEIATIAPTDPRMPRLVLSVIAPCLVMLIVDRRCATPIQPLFAQSPATLADGLWRFAMAGLADLQRA
ncbi:TetR/AcrR family transcriptional regulator [Azorhizophilus paspali]|uniref:TetR/AcrR family transcriptional regulator n=1 Tax=Azorhizophilus paspali TaxID=69963 RepID=A0ABV6SMP4_AZOPA